MCDVRPAFFIGCWKAENALGLWERRGVAAIALEHCLTCLRGYESR